VDGVLGGSRGSSLIDRGSRGFAVDNVGVSGNQGVIERSTSNKSIHHHHQKVKGQLRYHVIHGLCRHSQIPLAYVLK
jgi:hypothetical protein